MANLVRLCCKCQLDCLSIREISWIDPPSEMELYLNSVAILVERKVKKLREGPYS